MVISGKDFDSRIGLSDDRYGEGICVFLIHSIHSIHAMVGRRWTGKCKRFVIPRREPRLLLIPQPPLLRKKVSRVQLRRLGMSPISFC